MVGGLKEAWVPLSLPVSLLWGWGAVGVPSPPSHLHFCTGRRAALSPSQLWWPVPRTEIFSGEVCGLRTSQSRAGLHSLYNRSDFSPAQGPPCSWPCGTAGAWILALSTARSSACLTGCREPPGGRLCFRLPALGAAVVLRARAAPRCLGRPSPMSHSEPLVAQVCFWRETKAGLEAGLAINPAGAASASGGNPLSRDPFPTRSCLAQSWALSPRSTGFPPPPLLQGDDRRGHS